MNYKNIKNNGFTLVEMMVAVAVFSIVMLTAMSALLNVIDANNKARSVKTAINNISFALEGISKDIRVGTDYACGSSVNEILGVESGQDCINGGTAIKYRSNRTEKDGDKFRYSYYSFGENDDGIGQIYSCLEKTLADTCASNTFTAVTSPEVDITSARFYVVGNGLDGGGKKQQPHLIIVISGVAGPKSKTRLQTSFDLQTSVSQILRIKD